MVVKSDGSLWVILDGAPPERYNSLRSLAFAMAYYEQQNGGSPDDEQYAFDLFADLDLTGDLPDGLYEIEGQIVRYHSGRPEPV